MVGALGVNLGGELRRADRQVADDGQRLLVPDDGRARQQLDDVAEDRVASLRLGRWPHTGQQRVEATRSRWSLLERGGASNAQAWIAASMDPSRTTTDDDGGCNAIRRARMRVQAIWGGRNLDADGTNSVQRSFSTDP